MDFLYNIFIFPIESTMDFILQNVAGIVGYGWGIIILSILVNSLLIPIYNYAQNIMDKEQKLQFDMYPALLEIKQKYRGEQGFYKLKAIYKKYNYHPIKSLRSALGLGIQIPFFISAFILLSNHTELNNVSFLILHDLNAPDGLLGGIHILPFVMTCINIISGVFYTKTKQQKEQLFIISILFLVLLYNASAGLLLYWTFNNIFYLVKNILSK